MFGKKSLRLSASLCLCLMSALAADTTGPEKLTAAQIIAKNIAARGGLKAWRGVQTMSWSGKMDAGGDSVERSRRIAQLRGGGNRTSITPTAGSKEEANKQTQLPFVLEMKRPRKSRVEIQFAGKTAIQVYDGTNGWKVRPFLNRIEVESFTPGELEAEGRTADVDGPLVDFAAKGTQAELDGVEKVEGRDAYKLKLTLKDGSVRHVWIDAQNFLDVKIEGNPRRMDGKMHDVWVYQRDFREVQGVTLPFVLETVVDGYHDRHKMDLEKVEVNPKLDDSQFAKPRV